MRNVVETATTNTSEQTQPDTQVSQAYDPKWFTKYGPKTNDKGVPIRKNHATLKRN